MAKRLSGCGSGTEYLAVTPWGDLYPCHQFVGQEEFLMGNVDEGITKPEIARRISEDAVYIPKKNAKIVLQNFTAAADVWQTLIISMERSMMLMISAVRCRAQACGMCDYDQSSTGNA